MRPAESIVRWRIAILVSTAIAISYLDRQTLPVAIQAISRDIPLSNEQFSTLQSAFLFAYALMYAGGGRLVDMLGTRLGLTAIMLFWSFACASHALATGFAMLVISRFLLGVGEGGGFPAATRAVAEWFPTQERATAMGLINAGTAVGAMVAPPLIAVVLGVTNWRWVFLLAGAFGLLWTAWWQWSYRPASEISRVTRNDANEMVGLHAKAAVRFPWTHLFRVRETWGLVTAKFLSDAAWFFYLFWLPKYLYDARGFDIKSVGLFAWMPNAAAGIGCLFGGSFSSYLVRPSVPCRSVEKGGARCQRSRDAIRDFAPSRYGAVGLDDFLPGLFRPAILVYARDGAAHGSVPAAGCRIGRRTGGFRRRDGWNCVWAIGRIPTGSRLRLWLDFCYCGNAAR